MNIHTNLVEPGVRYFLRESLNQCKNFKENYYNQIFNISVGIMLFILIVVILFGKYKGKLSSAEKEKKRRQHQEYIMTKIQKYQSAKIKSSQDLITGLPEWNNDYELVKRRMAQ